MDLEENRGGKRKGVTVQLDLFNTKASLAIQTFKIVKTLDKIKLLQQCQALDRTVNIAALRF
jgi:hypothetical protein